METKFKIGDKVKVNWNLSEYGNAYEEIATVLSDSETKGRYLVRLIFKDNEYSDLSFKPEALTLVSSIPSKYWCILEHCTRIAKERETQYGDSTNSLNDTLEIMNSISKKTYDINEVRNFILALKLARVKHDPEHEDSQLDMINYLAIFLNIQRENK